MWLIFDATQLVILLANIVTHIKDLFVCVKVMYHSI